MANSMLRMTRKPETEQFLQRVISHPHFKQGLEALAQVHRSCGHQPSGLLLLGHTGVGKTTLIKQYQRAVSRPDTVAQDYRTVVHINIPASATRKGVLGELLFHLGCPKSDVGTETAMLRRLRTLVERQRTSMLIFDEIQHLLRSQALKDTRDVANFIKNLMSDLQIPIVLAGLPEAESVITAHPELDRRFAASFQLHYFSLETAATAAYFSSYLQLIQAAMAVPTVDLTEEAVLQRFFCASQGKAGLIARIIEATLECSDLSQPLDTTAFAQGYNHSIGQRQGLRFNPFSAEIDQVRRHLSVVDR